MVIQEIVGNKIDKGGGNLPDFVNRGDESLIYMDDHSSDHILEGYV